MGIANRSGARRRVVAWAGAAVGVSIAAPAPAQQQGAAPLVPIVTPLFSDDALMRDRSSLPVGAAFSPLQLSLVGGLFSQAQTLPGCASREDASGNSAGGFGLQRYSYLQLAPRLVLHGFSTAGCAIDSGLGGGLTYSLPLTKSLWLVSSMGFFTLPPLENARSTVVTTSARVDLVKHLGWGRTLSIGLGTRQRTGASQFSAMSFGGSF
jgi:hypothetical protein